MIYWGLIRGPKFVTRALHANGMLFGFPTLVVAGFRFTPCPIGPGDSLVKGQPEVPYRLLCAILAGGEGRRAGGEKPLLKLGKQRLIDRAVQLARDYTPEVIVVARKPDQVGEVAVPLVLDAPAIEGPVAGLAAALDAAARGGADIVLTIPCDMPFLPTDLAARLLGALPSSQAAIACQSGQQFPVCAAWRVTCRERLDQYLAGGRRSLLGFADYCHGEVVEWDGSAAEYFININTIDDLNTASGLNDIRLGAGGSGSLVPGR